jgi:phosphodiesterase/alkaline phosphatase D-like protein
MPHEYDRSKRGDVIRRSKSVTGVMCRFLPPENPHVRYFESRYRGYGAVDLFRDRMETRLQVISDRRDPRATLSTLKRFVVESGKAAAIPA